MAQKQTRYVIVRTYTAGVFAGVFVSRTGQELVLSNARRGGFRVRSLQEDARWEASEAKARLT